MTKSENTPTIKAGYRLTVESWENDGDANAIKIIDGLTKEECQFYCRVLDLINPNSKFANLYEPTEKELTKFVQEFDKILTKTGNPTNIKLFSIKNTFHDQYTYYIDNLRDSLCDVLYTLTGNSPESYFSRVCQSFKVELVEHDIYLPEVTSEFIF